MKRRVGLAFTILMIVTASTYVNAQLLLIRIEKPVLAGSLSGLIVDANGAPIPGVQVERMTASWGRFMERTNTNANGYFRFKQNRPGTYFLRLSANGFQEYEVKVRITRKHKITPKFRLYVAT